MRIYTVHLPPPYTSKADMPIALREGFNWWGFIFGGLWAMAVGMWLLGVILVALGGALYAALDLLGLSETGLSVVMLGFSALIGFSANDWRRAHLARHGWKESGVISAADRDGALRRYLDLSAIDGIDGLGGMGGGAAHGTRG